uniref:Uncharacterized protein n=2 Tax=Physcomitrium patens TaxID=3218 RepID=A0A2K1JDP0_PHYPA|nr:hypothetical protein PHYPA_019924 [Physcomitrium patens]
MRIPILLRVHRMLLSARHESRSGLHVLHQHSRWIVPALLPVDKKSRIQWQVFRRIRSAATMAFKAVFLLVALLAAVSAVAEAHEEKSDRFSLKIILHNTASRDVSFKLVNLGKHAYDTVVGKGDQWSAIGPVIVNLKFPVMRLAVSVTNKSYVLRKKLLKIDLERRFGRDYLKGKKFIVLTAQESWKKEFLFIKLGRDIVQRIKL